MPLVECNYAGQQGSEAVENRINRGLRSNCAGDFQKSAVPRTC